MAFKFKEPLYDFGDVKLNRAARRQRELDELHDYWHQQDYTEKKKYEEEDRSLISWDKNNLYSEFELKKRNFERSQWESQKTFMRIEELDSLKKSWSKFDEKYNF